VVSTDDVEIADTALKYGAEVPFMRPPELARDDSPEWNSWQHAIRMLNNEERTRKMDIFVSIPPTSPLRSVEDVDACIETLCGTDADIVITTRSAQRNPYFNMVTLDGAGYAHLAIVPEHSVSRRQDAPCVYDVITVAYAARPDFILRTKSMLEGKIRTVLVPAERALDIDTEFDFLLAEYILSQQSPNKSMTTPNLLGR
jgi:N-acylneuraminate cytidylyltransferase